MSYDAVWNIPFPELRRAGFRPLADQAWSGARDEAQFQTIVEKAKRHRFTTIVPLSYEEVHGRFRYTCDLSCFVGADLGFPWSYVPHLRMTAREKENPPWVNGKKIKGARVAGFGFFRSEEDAVAWKLRLS